jgi:MFS family permease
MAVIYLGTPFVLVAFLGVGLWGVATAVISGPSRTLLQRQSPERAHGRVMSADFVAGNGAELVGVALAGVLVGAFGVPWSILAVGLAVALTALALQRSHQRGAGRAPGAEPASPVELAPTASG